MSACEEPSDGVLIKFKYPNGHTNMRKFRLSEPIQILFDFVGQDDIASEIFVVQEAASSRSVESSSSGSIMDHGIKASSTLYVLWFSNKDVQEILSDQQNGAYALHHTSHGQSSLSETSTQPSLSEPPTRPLLPEPSTRPLLPEPSTQPPLTLFSQPQEILTLYDEPSLSPSSVQEPIIILDEQDESVSQNQPPVSTHHLGGPVDEIDLQTILKKMVSKVDGRFCPTSNQINVCRDNVLLCSLRAFKRRFFNPEAKLDVVFVDEDDNGEGAVDEGGPTREYLRLLMRAVHQSNIFEGHEKDRQLSLDTQALQTKLYMWVAKMIAVCVVHGGVGPHFFSERLFNQICGIPTPPAMVDEVCDHAFREQLIKIQEATTVREANSAIAEAADSLSIIGALRHVSSLEEKDSLVQSAADFFVNGRLATALDQFVEGLKTLGLLEELRKNPAVFYNMFVSEEIPLQAKDLCTLFDVDFSVQGSNRRDRENMTICFWRDWLIDIEEGECSPVTLEKVLEFTSGASTVPPLGFPHRPQIQFLHEGNRIFPEANTCILVLRLPLHSSYEAFKQHMIEGILQAPTFGLA
ncbi:G2/M phase-specific E3 ubiquitin-protein ligase isoform X2 [Carassius auratus]|uniref:HECT-type E3 ubiquitin transferase n=1 Tax=Carassius auratus TaxID=7957 RepID=A0A6P6JHQ4_CARAU|nr:G2/M phase-specific E3 ubiquitin-protein ligase-like isoform X2 [Carassius auratus]